MTGLPTLTVLLDDVSNGGTFPHDITTYARMPEGYVITRGRSDELSSVQAGTLALTLDNTDGRFTLGSTVGGYGAINLDRRIRVQVTVGATTSTRFTGYVQAWPVSWPNGGDTFATVTVTATDAQARAERRALRSVVEEEHLLAAPRFYWTLGDPEGSIMAAESAGSGGPALRQVAASNSGTQPVTFGTATGPPTDSLTAASFNGGNFLRAEIVPPETNAYYSVGATSVAFSCPTLPTLTTPLISIGDQSGHLWSVKIRPSDGWLIVFDETGTHGTQLSAGNVCDGSLHRLVWNNDAHVYLDGVDVGDTSGVGGTPLSAIRGFVAFGGAALFDGTGLRVNDTLTGTLAHAAFYSNPLTVAQVTALNTAMTTGFAGESSNARAARIASYAAIPSGVLQAGLTDVPFTDLTGKSAADALLQVADAEQGLAYIDDSGSLAFHNRAYVTTKAAADLSIDAYTTGNDVTFVADMANVINYATTKAESSDLTQTVADADSINAHGTYGQDYSWLVSTNDEALQRGWWKVNTHADAAARLPSLSIDLLTADATLQTSALGLDLDSWLRVTGLPTQAPTGTTADLTIEGWTETLNVGEWTLELNCSARALVAALILDDATFGVLDTTNRWGV